MVRLELFELLGGAKAPMLRLHLSKGRKTETSLEMVYGEIKGHSSVSPKYCKQCLTSSQALKNIIRKEVIIWEGSTTK